MYLFIKGIVMTVKEAIMILCFCIGVFGLMFGCELQEQKQREKKYKRKMEKKKEYPSNDPLRKHDLSKSWDEITGDSIKELEKELAGISSMVIQTGHLMCCVSYYQPNTKERNMKNILVKQDQFPTIQECKEQLEIDLGFKVEDVVLINWKEVSNNYRL